MGRAAEETPAAARRERRAPATTALAERSEPNRGEQWPRGVTNGGRGRRRERGRAAARLYGRMGSSETGEREGVTPSSWRAWRV
ncbi:hypothetical protein NL676_039633 [Syzygium grande]|nr:hypothetical protein NL676_039633 [Syzygium grande]